MRKSRFTEAQIIGILKQAEGGAKVQDLSREHGVSTVEKNLSLTEVYSADEMFTTGTMGELTPVLEVDGRHIADSAGVLTSTMQELYGNWVRSHGTLIRQQE